MKNTVPVCLCLHFCVCVCTNVVQIHFGSREFYMPVNASERVSPLDNYNWILPAQYMQTTTWHQRSCTANTRKTWAGSVCINCMVFARTYFHSREPFVQIKSVDFSSPMASKSCLNLALLQVIQKKPISEHPYGGYCSSQVGIKVLQEEKRQTNNAGWRCRAKNASNHLLSQTIVSPQEQRSRKWQISLYTILDMSLSLPSS